jgi:hypothetical protein
MENRLRKNNVRSRIDKIIDKIDDPSFLDAEHGMANEIPFHIFDYEPYEELFVRDYILSLHRKYENSNVKIIEIDLYNLMIEKLEKKIGLERIFKYQEKGKENFIKAIKPILKPDILAKEIGELANGFNLVFLTGIGKAYPFIRSHTILNNLHSILDKVTMIMFFPGTYTKKELKLFDRLKDDNYYRGFKLVD